MNIIDVNGLEKILKRLDDIENQIEKNNKGEVLANYWLTTKEASKYIKRSERTLYKLRIAGKIKFYQHSRKIVYKKSDCDAFLDEWGGWRDRF